MPQWLEDLKRTQLLTSYRHDTDLVKFLEEEEEEEDDEEDDEPEEDDDELTLADDDDEEPAEDDEEPDEVAASDEDDDEDEVPAKKSRAQDRIRRLANEKRQAAEENRQLKEQLAAINRQTQQQVQRTDPAAEAAFIAALSPEERIKYEVGQVLNQQRHQIEMMEFRNQDTIDRQAYAAQAAINPVYKRYAAEVEATLQDLRTKHRMNVPREEILKNIIGKKVLEGKSKTVKRDKAKANVKAATNKPSNGKSNLGRDEGRSGSERDRRRKRLENITF